MIFKATLSLATLLTNALLATAAFPAPHTITGDDQPGNWGGVHVHDPSIVLGPDGLYYSFSTHPLVAVSSSPTIDGYWTRLGNALSKNSIINLAGNNDLWAPDVHKVGSTYYMYYSVSQFGSQNSAIGVATSTTLKPGSWTDHGAVIQSGSGAKAPLSTTNAIDGNLFIDPKTNNAYLTYGSFWGDIWQFRLNSGYTSVTTSPAPVQVSLDPAGTRPEEGSYLSYSSSTGYYYLWISHGQCCGFTAGSLPAAGAEYSIRVGRSSSPTGPFVDSAGKAMNSGGGDIILGSHNNIYAPGGQGVLSNVNGRDILYYHYIDTNRGYSDGQKLMGYNYISYTNGWPSLS
ncbi:MAG: hypothetical protein M1820_007852 [Bogoriella megaspora]|nr:MAG: hypothetical protein M1820_007852 [Bogoriella megaspora]